MTSFSSNGIRISDLQNISLAGGWDSVISRSYSVDDGNGNLTDNDFIVDFSYLKYFSYRDNSFILPQIKFSSVEIPDNQSITEVTLSIADDNYMDYGTIIFPSTVQRVTANISTSNTYFNKLKFDIRKTSITKITYSASATGVNCFNLNYQNNNNSGAARPSEVTQSLFIIPNTENKHITSIGNYVEKDRQVTTIELIGRGMFDYGNISEGLEVGPLINNFTTSVINYVEELGYLQKQRLSNSSGILNIDLSAVKKTYASFIYGNGLPNITSGVPLQLDNVLQIGNFTFFSCVNNQLIVRLNPNVQYIGTSAFNNFGGRIITKDSIDDSATFIADNLNIKELAFFGMTQSQIFKFNNNQLSFGDYAIYPSVEGVYHNIYFMNNNPFGMTDTSFGDLSKKGNILHMTQTLFNSMMTINEFATCYNAGIFEVVHDVTIN